MKIRAKLVISLCLTFIIPGLLFFLCNYFLGKYQVEMLNRDFGTNITYMQYQTGFCGETIDQVTEECWDDLTETANEESGKMLDTAYLTELDEKLENCRSCLLVTKNGSCVYGSVPDSYQETAKKTETNQRNSTWYKDENLLIRGVSFFYADGGYGCAYIITDLTQYTERYWTHCIQVEFLIIIVLVLTVTIVAVVLYQSFYRPLLELRKYTRAIADGDLETPVIRKKNDEIGELFDDFEVMRQKLAESAIRQVEDDAEGKILVSNISHDLKTPLTSIKGYCAGLMDGVADTPERRDRYIRTIYNKAQDMERLLDELTYYSKINTNKIPYTFAKIDMSDYFEDCVEEISADLDAEGIAFSSENAFAGRPVLVIADPEQLKKVINNIIGNAVKYMDKPEPKISMRLVEQPSPDWVTVEIEDNGKGMAKEDLPKIFERFYRTDSARSSSTGGSGIGLSICHKIMNDHGGTIGADSTLGQGTIMRFSLKKHKED